MTTLRCKCGKDILLDDENVEKFKQYVWTCNGHSVAAYPTGTNLACLVIEIPVGFIPDHKDRNFHNNLKINLRVASLSQNRANTPKQKNNTTGYKGVRFHFRRGKYYARIQKDHKLHFLGYYETAQEAALAYNRGALKLFGEFAYLNKICNEEDLVKC